MGAKDGCIAEAALREPLMLGVEEGYRLWSGSYDSDSNPILALERRVIGSRLDQISASCILDVATGTGRWLLYARSRGARAFGLDLSPEMLAQAVTKPGLQQRLVRGDMNALPFRDSMADVAICSLALGYLPKVEKTLQELARVARRVIISDLHERAIAAGWNRSFENNGRRYQIRQFGHASRELDQAASLAGLQLEWREASSIGEPERMFFVRAGREHAFENACSIPAILSTCWCRE